MRQRIMQGAPASLTVTLTDQDGNAVAASGALTVGVTQADGTVLVAAGTATVVGSDLGVYTVALTAAQTALLNLLTATWTDGVGGRVVVTTHEVVGGFYFNLADVRGSNDLLLTDAAKYPDLTVLTTRQEVEEEAERICDVAFVRRYRRLTLDGWSTPELMLGVNRIKVIRSIRTYTSAGSASFVALTATQLAGLVVDPDGTLHRTDFAVFDEGRANIVVELEHGYDQPPADVKRAALTRLRSRLNFEKTAVNDRATSMTGENGQTYKLSMAEAFRTGIPEVDAAYERYSERDRGGKSVAVSRQLNYDPQRYSMWHGGVR